MANWVKRTKIGQARNGLLGRTKTDEPIAKGSCRQHGNQPLPITLRGSELASRFPTSETICIDIKVWFARFHIERVIKWR
jgi:hypothetical protein